VAEAEEIMMIGSQMACWLSLRKVRRSTPKREHAREHSAWHWKKMTSCLRASKKFFVKFCGNDDLAHKRSGIKSQVPRTVQSELAQSEYVQIVILLRS